MEITRSWGVFITLANIDHGGREKEKVNTEGGGAQASRRERGVGRRQVLGEQGKPSLSQLFSPPVMTSQPCRGRGRLARLPHQGALLPPEGCGWGPGPQPRLHDRTTVGLLNDTQAQGHLNQLDPSLWRWGLGISMLEDLLWVTLMQGRAESPWAVQTNAYQTSTHANHPRILLSCRLGLGARGSRAFRTSSQRMLMPLGPRPHSESWGAGEKSGFLASTGCSASTSVPDQQH